MALLGAAAAFFYGALAHAQPQPPTTEAQARYWVYGAFLTHAVPEIMGERVALGPELEQRLGVPSGSDRARIYDALMALTDGKPLRVRKATADEIARYKPRAKRELKDPLFTVQAGDISLLVEYDMQANTIPFVGQLDVAVVQQRSAPPVATIAPKPASARTQPPVPATEALKPNGPCVVNAVMSEQDLANCRAAPGGAARVQPGPPIVVKPQARRSTVISASPQPRRAAPCEVKPVMSEEDLANCRAAGAAERPKPAPPPAVTRAAPPAPEPERKASTPCVIKPVMTHEDLVNCGARPQ